MERTRFDAELSAPLPGQEWDEEAIGWEMVAELERLGGGLKA